ncbi:TPA: hypothetical protein ACSKMF_002211 [Listeria innocua]|nr:MULTISPECIES: hypothetical protein [Listeria]CUL20659.1 hypothetical protein LM7414_100029 [Listeria monocytogenes]CUL22227.1 hypothetical protein LM7416_100029 [Listeria monocytogenes]
MESNNTNVSAFEVIQGNNKVFVIFIREVQDLSMPYKHLSIP